MTKVSGILWLLFILNFSIGITMLLFTGVFTHDGIDYTGGLSSRFSVSDEYGNYGQYGTLFQGNNVSGDMQGVTQVSGSIANNPVSQPFNAFSALNLISINFLSKWFNMLTTFLNGIGIFLDLVVGQFLCSGTTFTNCLNPTVCPLRASLFGCNGDAGIVGIIVYVLWIWAAVQLWTGRNL